MKTPKPSINKNSKYHQDYFVPKNPKKYVGKTPIMYRSSWELTFMNVCDLHPNIIQWASESIEIAYQNPTTKRFHRYIPDFMIMIQDASGNKRVELIEIKPASQTLTEYAKSKRDKAALLINEAKWEAARRVCAERGMVFRVMTEHDLFQTKKSKR